MDVQPGGREPWSGVREALERILTTRVGSRAREVLESGEIRAPLTVALNDRLAFVERARAAGNAPFREKLGEWLVAASPKLMKFLTIVGTAAMFLVGGGILVHGIPAAHHLVEPLTSAASSVPTAGGVLTALAPSLFNAVAGILAGAILLPLVSGGQALLARFKR